MNDHDSDGQVETSVEYNTILYKKDGPVARITLNRPRRGNGITMDLLGELVRCVERADLDPQVHVMAFDGNGAGFCGGYDLTERTDGAAPTGDFRPPDGSPLDPAVIAANHDPDNVWDPVTDYQMVHRHLKGLMCLFNAEKPVLCKIHGFCVGGGIELALCADLLIVEDDAKIGYPPARMWGSPTTGLWAARLGVGQAKRLLFTGDCLSGREAYAWGLACDSAPADELDERFAALVERVARMPISQLVMQKALINQGLFAQGLHTTQMLGTFFDGIARHTAEGYAFQRRVGESGWRDAVRERDEPFGDVGASTFKG